LHSWWPLFEVGFCSYKPKPILWGGHLPSFLHHSNSDFFETEGYILTHPVSSNASASATQSNASICSRISSASDGLSVMNSIATEPSWNMAWSLSIMVFCHNEVQ